MGAQQPAEDPESASAEGTPSFGAVLTRWREHRAMSKKKLAAAMGFDPSYVSHVEAGRHPASEDFARKADVVLSADGSLWQAWRADGPSRTIGVSAGAGNVEGLVVEEDHARLEYDEMTYRPMQRRRLFNGGAEPVTRYLIRISVDRHLGQPEWPRAGRSNCNSDVVAWREPTSAPALRVSDSDRNRLIEVLCTAVATVVLTASPERTSD
ncbi:XRE family transcriptional regulator [Actinomadura spongiicola]|uniref:XRE family transcriptional regulator n=1 Tax=Actinomadura spongiicola TaxID=2303421 RepID=A0A372GPQ0_9ACTN|nr:helix-turn-helix transcriptional regulator [Actinomadura spongiicola]RFS87053.1 XRE family transcriptional regulator [Actinomadura spongiicola]